MSDMQHVVWVKLPSLLNLPDEPCLLLCGAERKSRALILVHYGCKATGRWHVVSGLPSFIINSSWMGFHYGAGLAVVS